MKTYKDILHELVDKYESQFGDLKNSIIDYAWNYTENNWEGIIFKTDGLEFRTKAMTDNLIPIGNDVAIYKDHECICRFKYIFEGELFTELLKPLILEIEKVIGFKRDISTAMAEYLFGFYLITS